MLDNFYIYSDSSMRCIRRTTRGCHLYRSFLLKCWFGRSGSSEFVGCFLCLRRSGYVPVPRVLAYRTRPTSGLEVSYGLRLASDYYKFYICTEFNCLFSVLFLKILFYISVLLLRTFNWKNYFSTYNTLSRKNILLIFEFYFT